MDGLLLGIAAIAVVGAIVGISYLTDRLAAGKEAEKNLSRTCAENRQLREQIEAEKELQDGMERQLEKKGMEIQEARGEARAIREESCKTISDTVAECRKILEEASIGFPWLCRAIAHYETLQDFRRADHLSTKAHPAMRAAQHVRETAARSKEYYAQYQIARSRLEYYESLFPWLEEYVGLDIDTLLSMTKEADTGEGTGDPVTRYLAKGEYEKLSTSERNQLALDRYRNQKKSPWQIGRDYERFIGYKFEHDGYSVEYTGIVDGLNSLARFCAML